jgi:hypothetical protein
LDECLDALSKLNGGDATAAGGEICDLALVKTRTHELDVGSVDKKSQIKLKTVPFTRGPELLSDIIPVK